MPTPDRLIAHPEELPRAYAVTVIGDVRVDIRGTLGHRFVELDTDVHESVTLTTSVGGTGMSFARAAAPHFATTVVLGAVGQDWWTPLIRAALAGGGVVDRLVGVDRPNSPVLVLRDRPVPPATEGIRLLVADSPSPYDDIDEALIRTGADDIVGADALVVDGYALLSPGSAQALEVATEIAATAGVPIGFDVVPHRIDERLGLADLWPILRRSSLIWVEADTLARLIGYAGSRVRSPADVPDLVAALPAGLRTPRHTWCVRFGIGQMDQSVAYAAGHHHVAYHTGYASAASTCGYGYYVAAAELKWWLTNLARAATRYPMTAQRRKLRPPGIRSLVSGSS